MVSCSRGSCLQRSPMIGLTFSRGAPRFWRCCAEMAMIYRWSVNCPMTRIRESYLPPLVIISGPLGRHLVLVPESHASRSGRGRAIRAGQNARRGGDRLTTGLGHCCLRGMPRSTSSMTQASSVLYIRRFHDGLGGLGRSQGLASALRVCRTTFLCADARHQHEPG